MLYDSSVGHWLRRHTRCHDYDSVRQCASGPHSPQGGRNAACALYRSSAATPFTATLDLNAIHHSKSGRSGNVELQAEATRQTPMMPRSTCVMARQPAAADAVSEQAHRRICLRGRSSKLLPRERNLSARQNHPPLSASALSC
jgi:hypothetical protein